MHNRAVEPKATTLMPTPPPTPAPSRPVPPLIPAPLPPPPRSILRHDAWSVAVNACVFLSVLVSYQINVNVWTRMMLGLFGPR